MSDALVAEVRGHLFGATTGVLSTLSTDPKTAGYPFGSVVPFALTPAGEPALLISRIAQHTRYLEADPRASLTVREPEADDDPQAGWRITVMGRFERLVATPESGLELERLHARYIERVPNAAGYFGTHDFDYWAMRVDRVRFIGGFGKIHWVEPDAYLRRDDSLAAAAPGIIAHMNADHRDALREYCAGLYGVHVDAATLEAVEPAGFFVRAPNRLFYVAFGREIAAADARGAFIEVLERARRGIASAAR